VDARLREGICLFNASRYFESHESFEDFYQHAEEEHKPFLEALVQLAAALRLFRDFGETKGPVRMVRQAVIRLENYQPRYLGIRVKSLIGAMELWAKEIEADSETAAKRIPKIPTRRLLFF